MSIPVLTQVYQEARRLAVAGSVVAKGDFRLKKLLPPLDAAGQKAPVFAKVAESARAVVDGPEDKSADHLLELTSLVTAVLYTQGEAGHPGDIEPIESINLGGASQISARLLKELLEALTSTGSGRLELIEDAHKRGLFQDLRLVRPAVNGLDDPYAEVADFLADNVLPMYGKAVLPDVRAKYDPKGGKGHPRRLSLMHKLDPDGSRELVMAALESGSKDVKVAAIGCLGKDDLSFLLDQTKAKAQDVRAAAYRSLAGVDHKDAVAALEKALAGKDLEITARAIQQSANNNSLTNLLAAEIEKERDTLLSLKDKKKVGVSADRLTELIRALPDWDHSDANRAVLELFARRDELAKMKGDNLSGSDVVEAVVDHMAEGPKSLQETLARGHAELPPDNLAEAIRAGRSALPPAEVYELFSPYLTAKVNPKKKGKDAAAVRREAVVRAFDGDYIWGSMYQSISVSLDRSRAHTPDPRWLDLAVEQHHLGLVHIFHRPGHAGAEAFAWEAFEKKFKNAKAVNDLSDELIVLTGMNHPKATDAIVATLDKASGKTNQYIYYLGHLIPRLPKSAIPQLEALVPKLKSRDADQLVHAIEELRAKP